MSDSSDTLVPSEADVRAFWAWFSSVAPQLAQHLDDETLLSELDRRVEGLGPFAWEVGPSPEEGKLAVVISPGGDRAQLPRTRWIVSLAPSVPGWTLHAAKPPKAWKRSFLVRDGEGHEIPVDAAGWRYALRRYPDGMLDVIVRAPDLDTLDKDLRQQAVETLLDGELGEETRLERVHAIDVVSSFLPEVAGRTNPIQFLREQLDSMK